MRFPRPARTIRAVAVAAASLAVVGTSALSASADPDFGTPDADDIVGVGSDTTQGVTNDLAKAYNGGTPAPTRRLASFDAVGSATIEIRPGVVINRPNGSSAGIREVTSNANVDFARSSRGRQTSDAANLRFLRFAQDNLRWMANEDVTGVASLTDAQLTAIYNCTTTNWSQVGGPNLAIVPIIPQLNSGTRNAWAQRVGIADPANPPSCVVDTVGGSPVQEHDPAPVVATSGSIAPVSQGRYNALDPEPVGAFLGTIPAPDDAEYNRNLFNVVKADGSGNVPAHLADIFGDGSGLNGSGTDVPWICGAEAQELISANGFTPLPAAGDPGTCGWLE